MADSNDIDDALSEAAIAPKAVSTQAGKVEAQPLPDQIAAAKYLKNKTAAISKTLGLRFRRFKSSAPVSPPPEAEEGA